MSSMSSRSQRSPGQPRSRSRKRSTCADPWILFSNRHRENALLHSDPLYALSKDLIRIIDEEAPGFFNDEELAFERDLAAATTGGFNRGRLFRSSCPIKSSDVVSPVDEKLRIDLDDDLRREGK